MKAAHESTTTSNPSEVPTTQATDELALMLVK
jgi:hypothetical protein